MAWLTPYVINGAAHSAALFRRQAQRPASPNAGIAQPADLKVTQLPAAADGFRIATGSLSLPSRFPARSRESYGVENGDEVIDVTGVTGTGSSARRDAVVVEVLDPNYLAITHEEAAPLNYMRVHVVQGVSTAATSIASIPEFNDRTAYVLAFINWPANQTAIQGSYIEDARAMASPLSDRVFRTVDLTEVQRLSSTTAWPAGGQTFPLELGLDDRRILIPDGTTHASLSMILGSVKMPTGTTANGTYWMQIGTNAHPDVVRSPQGAFDGAGLRDTWMKAAKVRIPTSMQGTWQSFFCRARLTAAVAENMQPYLNTTSSVLLDVQFHQEPI